MSSDYDPQDRPARQQELKLLRSIRNNDIPAFHRAIANGAPLDGHFERPPLQVAVRYSQLEIMRLLFTYNIKSPSKRISKSPSDVWGDEKDIDELLLAAYKGNLNIFQELWEYREKRGGEGTAPTPSAGGEEGLIHIAASNNDTPDVLRFLLDRGADVNVEAVGGYTPLHHAVNQPCARKEVVEFLIGEGANVEAVTEAGESVFWFAVQRGNSGIVRMLLEVAPDLARTGYRGESALWVAVRKGNFGVIRELLRAAPGLARRRECHGGEEMVHVAASRHRLKVVRVLVEAGADVQARTEGGDTILHLAAEGGRLETVKWMVENKHLRVNEPGSQGRAPLQCSKDPEMIKWLWLNSWPQTKKAPLLPSESEDRSGEVWSGGELDELKLGDPLSVLD